MQRNTLNSLLKEAQGFHADFEKHLKLMESLIERLRADNELLAYELELSTSHVRHLHSKLGQRLRRAANRKAVYGKYEE